MPFHILIKLTTQQFFYIIDEEDDDLMIAWNDIRINIKDQLNLI